MRPLVFALAIVFAPLVVGATIIHVPTDQSTIQAGINASVSGDTVLVADGTYSGDGNRDIDLGGKLILVRSMNGPEHTIVDCGGSVGEPHRGFNFHKGETSQAIIRGFTIKNGYGLVDPPNIFSAGGAIRCDSSSGPTIDSCVIRDCRAYLGGGIYVEMGAKPRLRNCTIRRNSAMFGGGIGSYRPSSSFSIYRCVLDSNTADSSGGAWHGRRTIAFVSYSSFTNNTAQWFGGAISLDTACLAMDSCQLIGNAASPLTGWPRSSGGAISLRNGGYYASLYGQEYGSWIHRCYFAYDSSSGAGALASDTASQVTVDSCTFVENWVQGSGGALAGGGLTVSACIFRANRADQWEVANGGAISFVAGSPRVLYCNFIDNSSHCDAGAVRIRSYSGSPPVAVTFVGCTFTGNRGEFECGAIYCAGSQASFTADSCVFIANYGTAVMTYASQPCSLNNCSFHNNEGNTTTSPANLLAGSGSIEVTRSILAFGMTGPSVACWSPSGSPGSMTLTECDVFGNATGDYVDCIAGQEGINGNFSEDPLFCDTANGILTIDNRSLCAPENRPDHELVGALGVACTCCEDVTGNVNAKGIVDLNDLSLLIAYLTVQPPPALPCWDEANVNGIGIVDLADLASLIGYLTGPLSLTHLVPCP